jgi:hypothetical protein
MIIYMKGSKDYIAIAGIVLVLIIFCIILVSRISRNSRTTPAPEIIPPITLEKQNLAKITTTPKAGVAKPKEDYQKVLASHQGRVIQFDEQCHAFPINSSFKAGTEIMLDNRGSLDREVTIGNHHSTIPAHDYMLYTLNTTGTLSLSCGPLLNSATILSQ